MHVPGMNIKFGDGRPDICMIYKEEMGIIVELKFNEKNA